jgi:hypothetical protein
MAAEVHMCGTCAFIGGMNIKLEQPEVIQGVTYTSLFVGINVGNLKAFKYSKNKKKFTAIFEEHGEVKLRMDKY